MHATVLEAIVVDLDGTIAVPPEGRHPLPPVEGAVVELKKAKKNGYLLVAITGAFESRVTILQDQTGNVFDIAVFNFGAVKIDYRSGVPEVTLLGSSEEQAALNEVMPSLDEICEMLEGNLCGKLGGHTVHYYKDFDVALKLTKEAVADKERFLRIYSNPVDKGIVVTYFSATKGNAVTRLESEGIRIVVGAGDGESDEDILLSAAFVIVTCTDEKTHANPRLNAIGEEKGENNYYVATPDLPHGHGFEVGMKTATANRILRSAPPPRLVL